MVFASNLEVSVSRFAARPGGAQRRHFTFLAFRNRVYKRGLAYARPSSDDHDQVCQDGLQCLALARSKRLVRPLFTLCDGLLEINRRIQGIRLLRLA
jgi:hypothetical protein